MIIIVITTDSNSYSISNYPEDNGCPYVIGEHVLQIFLTNPKNLYFNYQKAVIVIPYEMIVNVIYGDEAGKELAAFILSKKGEK
jgi:hypothetical protein